MSIRHLICPLQQAPSNLKHVSRNPARQHCQLSQPLVNIDGFQIPFECNVHRPLMSIHEMPQLDNASESLLHGGQKVKTRASRFWHGFADFALQDNVLEVAVGLMYVFAVNLLSRYERWFSSRISPKGSLFTIFATLPLLIYPSPM